MAGVRLATGYIEISAETSKVPQQIQDALSKAATTSAKPAGQQMGKDIAQGINDGLKSAPTSSSGSILQDVIQGKAIGGNVRAQGQKIGKEVATGINEGITQSATTGGKSIDAAITASAKPRETGKKIGKDVSAGINEGIGEGAGGGAAGQKINDAIVKQSKPREAGKKIGKDVSTGIDEGMKDAGKGPIEIIRDAAKDWGRQVRDEIKSGDVKGAFGDVGDVVANTTSAINNLGKIAGLNLSGIEHLGDTIATKLDTIGGTVQTVVDKVRDATGHARDAAAGFAAIGKGDAASRLQGVADTTLAISDGLKALGINVGDTPDKIAAIAQSAGGLAYTFDMLKKTPVLGPLAVPAAIGVGVGVTAYEIGKTPAGSEGPARELGPDAATIAFKRDATRRYADKYGANKMPPGTAQWLDGKGPIPPEMAPFYQVSGPEGPALAPPPGWAGPSPEVIAQRQRQARGEEPPPPPTVVPGAAAAPGKTQVAAASVQSQTATVSIGSATVSGLSVQVPLTPSQPQAIGGGGGGKVNFWTGKQSGGDISGSGPIPIIAHGGEHVLTANDVDALGGQQGVYALRNMLHYQDGGAVDIHGAGGDGGTPGWLKDAADKAGMSPDQYLAVMGHMPPGGQPGMPGPGRDSIGQQQGDMQQNMFEGMFGKTPDEQTNNLIGMARTAGFIPVGAGSKAVAGTSFVAGLLNLGNEAVAGLIDTGASAAKMAASAAATMGTAGAGGQAGAAAAGIGIDMAAGEAKRAVSYGFQVGSILADSAIDQLFGAFGGPPRWLGYDYTQFAPHLNISAIGTTTVEKAFEAMKAQQTGEKVPGAQQPGGPVTPEHLAGAQPVGLPVPKFGGPQQPVEMQAPEQGPSPGQQTPPPGGAAAGIQAGMAAQPPAPSEAAQPSLGTGPEAPPPTATAAPGATPTPAPSGPFGTTDIFSALGITSSDEGSVLMPNGITANTGQRPELVLSPQQMDALSPILGNGKNPYSRGGDTYHITTVNAEDVGREIDKRKRLAMMQYSGRP